MIEIRNLTKKFGQLMAVNHLDLTVGEGEFFAFIGPNGAGKTTTIKLIAGLLQPTEGEVFLCGHNVHRDQVQAKYLLSYVPDQPYLYDNLTGLEFLQFVARMYRIGHREADSRIAELSEAFEFGPYVDQLAETYSHGMKQRIVMSAALLHEPKVIVVDEPMVGLDPRSANTLKRVLKERSAQGVTVFMSTHDLPVAEQTAERVGIIHEGRLVALGTLEQIYETARTDGRLEDAFLRITEDTPAA